MESPADFVDWPAGFAWNGWPTSVEYADYGIDKLITEEMAKDIIEQCQSLEEHVESYLIEPGTMTS